MKTGSLVVRRPCIYEKGTAWWSRCRGRSGRRFRASLIRIYDESYGDFPLAGDNSKPREARIIRNTLDFRKSGLECRDCILLLMMIPVEIVAMLDSCAGALSVGDAV